MRALEIPLPECNFGEKGELHPAAGLAEHVTRAGLSNISQAVGRDI